MATVVAIPFPSTSWAGPGSFNNYGLPLKEAAVSLLKESKKFNKVMKSNFPCEKERQRRLNEFLWLLDVNAGLNHRDSEPIEFEEGKMPLAQVDALVAAARKVLTKNADKLSRTKLARFELDVLVDRRARPAETQPARATTELIWLLTQNPNIISRPYGMANELPRSVFTSDHKGCCASKGKESPAPPSSVSSTICGDKEK